MTITDKQSINALVFLLSAFIIGMLTAISFIGAFAFSEGTASGIVVEILSQAFLVFRFPVHNLIWLKPELIGALFVPGLFINTILYATLATWIMYKFRNRNR